MKFKTSKKPSLMRMLKRKQGSRISKTLAANAKTSSKSDTRKNANDRVKKSRH